MEDITDAEYAHGTKRICKTFEIKTLREYNDLYVMYLGTLKIFLP